MATFAELIAKNSQLTKDEIDHLSELVAEWRLLADLSFADLLLWLPIRKDEKSWPDGYVLVAQIRPTTAATVFNDDLVGSEMAWGVNSRVDHALANGEILRDTQPEKSWRTFDQRGDDPRLLCRKNNCGNFTSSKCRSNAFTIKA
jgi:two-component system, sensor histidine kinase PdtaS